jgi:ABC-2 type transport system permease protein
MSALRVRAIVAAQFRLSLMVALQYRADFLADLVVEAFWIAAAIFPLLVVFKHTASLGGWSFDEALAVSGVFAIFQGVMESVISPSLSVLLEQVKKGTFDFVLLKPVDAQFLTSVQKLQPWRALNVVLGVSLLTYSMKHSHRAFALGQSLLFLVTLLSGLLLFYALWLAVASVVFVVKRLDNLTYLLVSIFDAARWPRSAFRGVFKWLFTFVIPLAVMTSFPAEVLLGKLDARGVLFSLFMTCIALLGSRAVWNYSIARYGSASS